MIRTKKIILFIGDIALLYFALWVTLRLRFWSSYTPQIWQEHILPFSLVFILWIVVFYINNLYSVNLYKNNFRFYAYLLQNQILNTVLALIFFYSVPTSFTSLRPLRILAILVITYTIFFLLWRRLFYSLSASNTLAANVLFIGLDRQAIELIEEMKDKPQMGYKTALIIQLDPAVLPPEVSHLPIHRDLIQLKQLIIDLKINTVVTSTDPRHAAQISKYLFDTINLQLRYFNLPDFYELITGKIPVASLEKNWFLENISQGRNVLFESFKRVEDIILAGTLGILTSPVTLILAIMIKLDSAGPILYSQQRTGKGGKTFMTHKFRSMRQDAESGGQAVWAAKNDSRVTKIGRFMRRSRLDEIPQVINILNGEMSFVGPRPERPEFVKILNEQIPFYTERLLVKPGLTGWAQINFPYGDSVEDAMKKLQYDLFYIKNRSLALDLSIILKTINTVFNRTLGQ